jgi:hypothetical protein
MYIWPENNNGQSETLFDRKNSTFLPAEVYHHDQYRLFCVNAINKCIISNWLTILNKQDLKVTGYKGNMVQCVQKGRVNSVCLFHRVRKACGSCEGWQNFSNTWTFDNYIQHFAFVHFYFDFFCNQFNFKMLTF